LLWKINLPLENQLALEDQPSIGRLTCFGRSTFHWKINLLWNINLVCEDQHSFGILTLFGKINLALEV